MRAISAHILLSFALAGCATSAAPRQDFAQIWVGKPLDAFVVAHGVPQARQAISDGKTVVEWSDVFNTPNTGSPVQTLIGAAGNVQSASGAYQLVCKIRFVVARNGQIEQSAVVTDTYGLRGTSRCAEVFSLSR